MLESKKDCFAYVSESKTGGCFSLNELYCRNENCKFYQKKELAKKRYLDSYSLITAQTIGKNIDKFFREL
ncbi:MAG: hypothetical protein ACI4U9_04680 [Clostridia bacterium]